MKKHRSLFLLSITALFLSGCEMPPFVETAKDWALDSKDWVLEKIGINPKEEQPQPEEKETPSTPEIPETPVTPETPETPVTPVTPVRPTGPAEEPEVVGESISLASKEAIVSVDEGHMHQLTKDENVFDIYGWEDGESALGSIKQNTHGSYVYDGMIYNRTSLYGVKNIMVNFDDSKDLYLYKSTQLFQEVNLPKDDAHKILKNTKYEFGENDYYFVLYTDSDEAVSINKIVFEYAEEHTSPNYLYEELTLNNARSVAKSKSVAGDLINLENNPLSNTNNYSQETINGKPGAWYRWNGVDLPNSKGLGYEFDVQTTILGNASYMCDESKLFNYSVWIELEDVTTGARGYWDYAIIGNDNYEPLGKENAIHPEDKYVAQAYPGRFYTSYVYENDDYIFADPDTHNIVDDSETLRQAYAENKLPVWNVHFKFKDSKTYVTINNKVITVMDQFDYEGEEASPTDTFRIARMELHLVNFGNPDGSPKDSYTGSFSVPRIL